jgi:CRP/FNR family transcriptional regulator
MAGLDRGKVIHRYRKGQILHYEGNPAAGVDCIRAGRVKVYRSAPRDRQHILRIAEEGDVLGLESILTGDNHASTAEMIDEGTICHLDREAFLAALESNPAALRAVTDMLAEQLLRSEAERAELAGGSVRERMASTLLDLARRYGVQTKAGVRIDLTLSREDLAEMIGTTPETAIRQLSEFRTEGIVATRGRSITIEDPARLGRAAHARTDQAPPAERYQYLGRPK